MTTPSRDQDNVQFNEATLQAIVDRVAAKLAEHDAGSEGDVHSMADGRDRAGRLLPKPASSPSTCMGVKISWEKEITQRKVKESKQSTAS